MTNILPFKAIRPVRDKVQLVASKPYYTYSKKMLDAEISGNPYTFIHIINPEFLDKEKTRSNSKKRFKKVRQKFEHFFDEGLFLKEKKESLYAYRQTTDTHEFLGFIGGADLKEYKSGQIKKHEETISKREKTFSKYLKVVNFNAEPILLFHKEDNTINKLLSKISKNRPEYEYTTRDGIKHELWIVSQKDDLNAVKNAFKKLDDVYIADGHHRCASSYRFYESAKKTKINQHTMAFFISEKKLNILDFNRVIKDLNHLSVPTFMNRLEKHFKIQEFDDKIVKTVKCGKISMYLDKRWYILTPNKNIVSKKHPVDSLDTQILTAYILKPILNISDLRSDDRISFISGDKGMEGLKKLVDKGEAKVAFGLFPVTTSQLIDVADANLIMPPKSTWIEPKLRSGLTIYPLDE